MDKVQTQAKHTPTPWMIIPGSNGLSISGNDPEGVRYQEIARMIDGNTTSPHLHVTADEQKANAQHIVHCVNLYPDLVRVLALVQDQLNEVYDGAEDSGNRWMGEMMCEVSRVMGLVRKGEGA